MMRLKLFIFVFVVLIASCDQPAGSKLDKIIEEGVLRVGTTGDYKPFSYLNDGALAGIDIELASDLAASLGVELEFMETSWPTLMDDLAADKFDVGMSGITITDARLEVAMFSLPMHQGGKAAITRDADVEKFDTLAEINQPHVRVIFNPGGTNESFARENFPDATLIENPENITVFSKIISGEADVMVTDAIETIVQERIYQQLDAVNADTPFSRSEKAYLINNDEKFKRYLDDWINELKSSGRLSEIFNVELEKSALAAIGNGEMK